MGTDFFQYAISGLTIGAIYAMVGLMSKKTANFIGIITKIKLVERGSLKRDGNKVKPFVDRRLEATTEDTGCTNS